MDLRPSSPIVIQSFGLLAPASPEWIAVDKEVAVRAKKAEALSNPAAAVKVAVRGAAQVKAAL